ASPILALVVSGNRSLRELTEIAKDWIKEPLESISGVGSIDILGGRQREIQVYVDPERLQSYGLTIDRVRAALQAQNLEVPGGRVDLGATERVLRTMGRIQRVEEFNELIVDYVKGAPIKIADVARVEDGVVEPRNLSRLNGRNAVTLLLRRQSGTNTVQVADRVFSRLDELRAALPAGVDVQVIRDQSRFIRRSVGELSLHLVLGGILASFVVLLFLRNLRSALIAAVSIPTSLIATFTLIRMMGFTINNMTLLGLTLAVGIVIDDAIVVLENIFRHVEEGGQPPRAAAVAATKEIGLAVMATTLSLVVIFLPVGFMSGMVGRFFSSYGLTMAFAVMVSLLVAFTLTPTLCSLLFRAGKSLAPEAGRPAQESEAEPEDLEHIHGQVQSRSTALFRGIDRIYGTLLSWALQHRLALVLISVATVLFTVPLFLVVGKDIVPFDDQSEFEVQIKLPPGYNLDRADGLVKGIEERLAKLRGVRDVLTTVGEPLGISVSSASVYVRLVDLEERRFSQFDVMADARRVMAAYPELRTSVQNASSISVRGNTWHIPLNFALRGPDLQKLEHTAGFVAGEMKKIPGFVDVDTSLELGKPELRVVLDREKAAALGSQVADVAHSLRTLVGGERVTRYRELDEQYDVRLRLEEQYRNDLSYLQRLAIPSRIPGGVELANLSLLRQDTGPVEIQRFNRQRTVSIFANLEKSKPLASALDDTRAILARAELPAGYDVAYTGRSKTLGEAQTNFVIAFILSVIFMYMVLAAQFESFIHPVTIMLSLPLCVPFALFSLWVTRETLNIYSALGLLVLFGIVKKNAILQVDYANTLRRHGQPRDEAVPNACHTRLRPILMTTMAFVAGMVPIALGTGPGSASRRSIAIVAMGGQTLCLLITLLVTPVAYTLFDDLKQRAGVQARALGASLAGWRKRLASVATHFLSLVAGR
ncbi:MAG: efflux RND transporter permease subunit, partial [Acidobacteria bacterium]|nr:efflux RND transporter permease subunit [Acidobacteriota bacterium]